MVTYIARRRTRFEKLKKEGWTIPEKEKGYFLYRDSNLPEKARELVEIWSGGEYDWDSMCKFLRKLERPVPGATVHGGQHTRLLGFNEDESEVWTDGQGGTYVNTDQEPAAQDSPAVGPDLIYMHNSFFLTPESFDDDDILDQAVADANYDDDGVLL